MYNINYQQAVLIVICSFFITFAVGSEPTVAARPLSELMTKCQSCHAQVDESEFEVRKLVDMHTDIHLDHGNGALWCFSCHNPKAGNTIHVEGKEPASFQYSAGLCSKCHASIYADWKKGVHSKITGYMTANREKKTCVDCHNPHHPKFKALVPDGMPDSREQRQYHQRYKTGAK